MGMGADIAGIPFILFLWLLLPVRAWSRLSYSSLLVAVLSSTTSIPSWLWRSVSLFLDDHCINANAIIERDIVIFDPKHINFDGLLLALYFLTAPSVL